MRLTYRSRVTQRFSVGASVNFESRLGGQSLHVSRSFYMSYLKPRVFACLFKEDTKAPVLGISYFRASQRLEVSIQ